MQKSENLRDLKVTIEHVNGTNRQVADAARTTISLDSIDKRVTDLYMRRMYLCEHSPIRIKEFNILIENIPYWIAMHLVRHHVGVTPFVSTQREDRVKIACDRDHLSQGAYVNLRMVANAQAMIAMSRKRLCKQAHKDTQAVWKEVLQEIEKIDGPLFRSCVPECVYRGYCYEFNPCGFTQDDDYLEALISYRITSGESK